MHFKVFPAIEPIGRGDPITPARRKRLFFSYFPDWLLTIVLAALFYALDAIDGFRRDFSLEDTSLRHPYAVHERVPNTLLLIICAVVPFALMPIVNFITVRSYWDFHNSSLGLVLSLALTGAVTQTIKITVGRPRPDIISRCQPPPGSQDPVFGLTNSTICTQTDKAILIDGFRSFPSGHSSLSFAGLGFLAFYLAGKLHLFDKRGHTGKAWISLFPFLGAALVAISRSMDYRHHWQDILVGSLLGTALSFFSYRQYYPSLSAPLSHRPYSPRIPNDDSPKPSGIIPMYHNNQGRNSNTHLVAPKPGSGGMMVSSSGTKYGNNSYEDLRSTASPDQDYTGYDGTVPRPVPRDLTAVWKEGDDGHEGDVAGRDSRDRDTYPPLPHPRHLTGSARVSESSSGLDHHTPTQAQFVPYPQYASPSSLVAGSRSASPAVTSPMHNAPGTSAVMAESGSTGQRL